MKSETLRARVEPEFADLIHKAAVERNTSESEVIREVLGTGFQAAFASARENVVKSRTQQRQPQPGNPHAAGQHIGFANLQAHLQDRGLSADHAAAVAASIGRAKFGAHVMDYAAHHAVPAPTAQRRLRRHG
jgi:hypothetical protein